MIPFVFGCLSSFELISWHHARRNQIPQFLTRLNDPDHHSRSHRCDKSSMGPRAGS